MAELLGVSLRQYQRWEHGISAPRERQLARIRGVLAAQGIGEAHDVASLRDEVAALRAELEATRAELDALAVQVR
jgi:transcriptional regulator with XRE-family HTH domain